MLGEQEGDHFETTKEKRKLGVLFCFAFLRL